VPASTSQPAADGTETPAVALTRAFLHVLAAALTGSAERAQAGAAAADALECQTPDGQLARHPELPGLLHTALGSACLWEGRLDAARNAFLHAVELSGETAQTAATRQDALSRLALIVRGAMRYEIRIAGRLPEAAARAAFPELEVHVVPAQTVLSGQVTDEAHLYCLLARLHELGVCVTELRRVGG